MRACTDNGVRASARARELLTERVCTYIYVCVCAPEAKVKYAAAPASRSIMRRVTHASLLHCEPCYASARQGARRIYGGISAVIERYAPSSRYLFLPAGAPRRAAPPFRSAPLLRPPCPHPVPPFVAHYACEQLPKPRELASTCSENIERHSSARASP